MNKKPQVLVDIMQGYWKNFIRHHFLFTKPLDEDFLPRRDA